MSNAAKATRIGIIVNATGSTTAHRIGELRDLGSELRAVHLADDERAGPGGTRQALARAWVV